MMTFKDTYSKMIKMETVDFTIDKKKREPLGNGRRIYNVILGMLFLVIGGNYFLENGFSIQDSKSVLNEFIILAGFLSITFGLWGREPYRTRYRLKMDNDTLRIKKSFERELIINLNSMTHLKAIPLGLVITYNDYIKTYDFFWLDTEEYETFKARITDYCLKNKIEIE
jgi:hypothetical protein